MMRFVTVELCERDSAPGVTFGELPYSSSASALTLTVSSPSRVIVLVARVGLQDAHWPPVLDEHFAADAEVCRERDWLDCADVLHGRRPRPVADAMRWLADLTAAHSGCRLAAVPLIGGGWAALGGTDRQAVVLPCEVSPGQPLLPSCLHGWLIAGHSLRQLASARLSCGSAVGHYT